MFVQMTKQIQF